MQKETRNQGKINLSETDQTNRFTFNPRKLSAKRERSGEESIDIFDLDVYFEMIKFKSTNSKIYEHEPEVRETD